MSMIIRIPPGFPFVFHSRGGMYLSKSSGRSRCHSHLPLASAKSIMWYLNIQWFCHYSNPDDSCQSLLHIKFIACYLVCFSKNIKKLINWIGLRDNLQETPMFHGKIYGRSRGTHCSSMRSWCHRRCRSTWPRPRRRGRSGLSSSPDGFCKVFHSILDALQMLDGRRVLSSNLIFHLRHLQRSLSGVVLNVFHHFFERCIGWIASPSQLPLNILQRGSMLDFPFFVNPLNSGIQRATQLFGDEDSANHTTRRRLDWRRAERSTPQRSSWHENVMLYVCHMYVICMSYVCHIHIL